MDFLRQPASIVLFSSSLIVAATVALSCSDPPPPKTLSMSLVSTGQSYQTNNMIESLYRRIQSETAGVVGNAYRQSLPIPVRENGATRILVMLCPAIVTAPQGSQIMPPTHIALYDPAKGTLVEMRAVQPSDFQQSHTTNQIIGTVNLPPGVTYDGYLENRRRLFQALDRLLSSYSVQAQTLTDTQREAARDFKSIFSQLREQPLEPYYQHTLKGFASWLNQFNP